MAQGIARLKRRAEFLRVADGRLRWATPGLVLQALNRAQAVADGATENAPAMRVGFTVSKKVGNAVERNRVRRRLRAACGRVFPQAGRPLFDYVVVGRRTALARSFAALVQDLSDAVAQVHRLSQKSTGRPLS